MQLLPLLLPALSLRTSNGGLSFFEVGWMHLLRKRQRKEEVYGKNLGMIGNVLKEKTNGTYEL